VTARRAIVVIAAAALALVSLVVARRTSGERVAAAVGARPAANAAAGTPLPVLDAGPAPDVAALTTGWLNTAPLTPADLGGKVVLYDLWTFGCVNCQHTVPNLRVWHDRYAADGLVIVGVHSPEFDYERDPANVAVALRDQRIAYPVALDPEHRIWRAFDNHYWPSFFLHDRSGARRYTHIGEGAYATTEDAIRQLLGVDPASPRAAAPS
jgi:thiol-disulfide isomerase/thioredoxin